MDTLSGLPLTNHVQFCFRVLFADENTVCDLSALEYKSPFVSRVSFLTHSTSLAPTLKYEPDRSMGRNLRWH